MNRTDRLLAIILELQGKDRQRAEDLAATFETSKRTIYRDIQALCESGVPVVSTPGQGYALMEGYFLPPLSFSVPEATMLLLGSDLMAQHFDEQYREAALAAARKISGALPKLLHEEVRYLRNNIVFVAPGPQNASDEHEKLLLLRRTILDRRCIRFTYHTRHGEQNGKGGVTSREVNPYRLVSLYNIWNLVAYCHLRQEIRHFRLDRIEAIEVLASTFQRPYELENPNPQERRPRPIVVRVLFAPEIARWLQETPNYFMTNCEETPDGLLITLHIRHEQDIMPWLLGWGRHARVLEPITLRQRVEKEARAMLQRYQGID
ncbi:helix-turn-helix transcriptional regulator [Ktedonospora formicarum]|uniref:Transcriptional regulator n=1 Tax=Ktedonospora formicarum TaxID=2778364 RepID=A0A8J3I014_9CHLR|nr:YafY family protein [Ktedonospora formicarum]GHO44138.1 transcriptional regulator [Ktedonospora formicarum]